MHFHITWEQAENGLLFTTDGVEIGFVECEFEGAIPHLTEVDIAWHHLVKYGRLSQELSEEFLSALGILKEDYLSDRNWEDYTWRFLSWNDPHNWYLTDQKDAFEPIVA